MIKRKQEIRRKYKVLIGKSRKEKYENKFGLKEKEIKKSHC